MRLLAGRLLTVMLLVPALGIGVAIFGFTIWIGFLMIAIMLQYSETLLDDWLFYLVCLGIAIMFVYIGYREGKAFLQKALKQRKHRG